MLIKKLYAYICFVMAALGFLISSVTASSMIHGEALPMHAAVWSGFWGTIGVMIYGALKDKMKYAVAFLMWTGIYIRVLKHLPLNTLSISSEFFRNLLIILWGLHIGLCFYVFSKILKRLKRRKENNISVINIQECAYLSFIMSFLCMVEWLIFYCARDMNMTYITYAVLFLVLGTLFYLSVTNKFAYVITVLVWLLWYLYWMQAGRLYYENEFQVYVALFIALICVLYYVVYLIKRKDVRIMRIEKEEGYVDRETRMDYAEKKIVGCIMLFLVIVCFVVSFVTRKMEVAVDYTTLHYKFLDWAIILFIIGLEMIIGVSERLIYAVTIWFWLLANVLANGTVIYYWFSLMPWMMMFGLWWVSTYIIVKGVKKYREKKPIS